MEAICRRMQRMADPSYLNTMSLDELLNNVYMSKSAVVDGLLSSGVYILAGAPKVGKSFLVAQISFYVSTGQKLWNYAVHQGTVLYLALEDDQRRLQQRMSRMFGVDGTRHLHFATSAGQVGKGLNEQLLSSLLLFLLSIIWFRGWEGSREND